MSTIQVTKSDLNKHQHHAIGFDIDTSGKVSLKCMTCSRKLFEVEVVKDGGK